MKVPFVNYKKDYLTYKKEYDRAWRRINMSGDLILRKDVEEFEERLAKYVGTKYAVALSSGTDALVLSLRALGANRLCKVSVPSHTFKSTCGAVLTVDANPVLYDLGDEEKDPFTDIHIVAHIAGELYSIPTVYQNMAIEDACQALGALKNPTSRVQCWSFYPAKILGCKGDAGAITTNDEKVYDYIKEARNHFKTDNRDFGGNYRMDNLQAALLNIKIQHIESILSRRRKIADMYLTGLNCGGLPSNYTNRVWQDFIVRTSNRNELYDFLKHEGVETMKNEYPFSPAYPKLPLAAKYESETLRLPCNETLTDREVNYVIKKVNEFFI